MDQLPYFFRQPGLAGPPVGDQEANQAARHLRQGRPQQALQAALKALALDPQHPTARANLASALLELGRPDEAADILHGLPGRYAAPGLARLAVARGQGSQALEQANQAVHDWGAPFHGLQELAHQASTAPGAWLHSTQYRYHVLTRRGLAKVLTGWALCLGLVAWIGRYAYGPAAISSLGLILAAIASSRPTVLGRIFLVASPQTKLPTRGRGLVALGALAATLAFALWWALAEGTLNLSFLSLLLLLPLWLEDNLGASNCRRAMATQLLVIAGYFWLRQYGGCPRPVLAQIFSLTLLFDLGVVLYAGLRAAPWLKGRKRTGP
ncbi:MAG: tetratricopeptide repeat protein [Vulcanimicrobiota bacterium]